MMVSARIFPIPGTSRRRSYGSRSFTFPSTTCSMAWILRVRKSKVSLLTFPANARSSLSARSGATRSVFNAFTSPTLSLMPLFRLTMFCKLVMSDMNLIPPRHKQIDQPVPVVRRLDGDIGDVIFERPQGIDDDRWIVLELLVESTLTMLVD